MSELQKVFAILGGILKLPAHIIAIIIITVTFLYCVTRILLFFIEKHDRRIDKQQSISSLESMNERLESMNERLLQGYLPSHNIIKSQLNITPSDSINLRDSNTVTLVIDKQYSVIDNCHIQDFESPFDKFRKIKDDHKMKFYDHQRHFENMVEKSDILFLSGENIINIYQPERELNVFGKDRLIDFHQKCNDRRQLHLKYYLNPIIKSSEKYGIAGIEEVKINVENKKLIFVDVYDISQCKQCLDINSFIQRKRAILIYNKKNLVFHSNKLYMIQVGFDHKTLPHFKDTNGNKKWKDITEIEFGKTYQLKTKENKIYNITFYSNYDNILLKWDNEISKEKYFYNS